MRKEFVNPLNVFLHSAYPKAWRTLDAQTVLEFYAEELRGDATEVSQRIRSTMARFVELDHTYAIIKTVDQVDGEDEIDAPVILRLRGLTPDGRRLTIERFADVRCRRDADRNWHIVSEDVRDELVVYSREPAYRDESEDRGVDFVHRSGGVADKFGEVQDYSPGSGLAVGDFDGDGADDFYLVSGSGGRLFRNRGDGRFEDVTEASGLDLPPPEEVWPPHPAHWEQRGEGRCAVFVDYDNDGQLDLFIGKIDAPNELWRNRGIDGGGHWRFEEVGERAGIIPENGEFETTGACFADFDGNGWIDLYVANGGNLLRKHPEPPYNALDATANRLWLSNGDGTFHDATEKAGVGHAGWALAVSANDYDIDGDVDIFVGNDVGFNVLYRNRGDATFDEVTQEAGIVYRGTTMSSDWADINGDGRPDLFVAAMDSNSSWMVDQPGFPAPAPWYINLMIRSRVIEILRNMLYGNRLYVSNPDGTFTEESTPRGLRHNGWAWSSIFFDYDGDGLLDLYSTNGFISGNRPDDL